MLFRSTLSDMAFKLFFSSRSRHTIDRFSSDESVRVRSGRYNSRFWRRGMEGCQGIDAFLQDWQGENNWVHPPYKLVGRVVQHMRMQGAQGTVVIPWWTRAAWWPLVREGEGWSRDAVGAVCLGDSVGWHRGNRMVGSLVPPRGGTLADLPVAQLWAVRFDCRSVSQSGAGRKRGRSEGWGVVQEGGRQCSGR